MCQPFREVVRALCSTGRSNPGNVHLDHADYMAPVRQLELDHTDHTEHPEHTDQEYNCPYAGPVYSR